MLMIKGSNKRASTYSTSVNCLAISNFSFNKSISSCKESFVSNVLKKRK